MFENPRRGRQARSFTTNVSKILDLKSSSEQIFFRKLSLGAPERAKPSPIKNNRTKFSGEKKYNEAFRVEYFFENTLKT